MKLTTQLLTMLVISLFGVCVMQSQTEDKIRPLKEIVYAENVNTPLTPDELQKIQEAYGTHAESLVLDRPNRINEIKDLLRNRVVIEELNGKNPENLIPISSLGLFSSFNPAISEDASFSVTNFNPLKYMFDFYKNDYQIFWVDNTDYIVRLKPQHHN